MNRSLSLGRRHSTGVRGAAGHRLARFGAWTLMLWSVGARMASGNEAPAQGQPESGPAPTAEIRFDQRQNRIALVQPGQIVQAHLTPGGSVSVLENLTTGERIEFDAASQKNIADALGKWQMTSSAMKLGGKLVEGVQDAKYRSAQIFLRALHKAGVRGGSSQYDFADGAKLALDNAKAHLSAAKRTTAAFKATDLALAINADISGIVDHGQPGAHGWIEHGVLGKTSEKTASWFLAERMLEPALKHNAANIGTALQTLKQSWWLPKAAGAVVGNSIVPDIAAASVATKHQVGLVAKWNRLAMLESAVTVGYGAMKGKSLKSPEMVSHYFDMVAAGGFGAAPTPMTKLIGAAFPTARKIGDEIARPHFERWGESQGNMDRGRGAALLYQMSSMALHGVNPTKEFAMQAKAALERNPNISGGKDYHALWKAYVTGDAAGAASAFARLAPLMVQGGIDHSTVEAMGKALVAKAAPRPQETFAAAAHNLGGVALRAVPEWESSLGRLTGAAYDHSSGQLVLLGDGDRAVVGLSIEDLAAAFACVFGVVKGNTRVYGGPEFSLDPADETNPDGPWQRAVYIPDFLYGTKMGQAMYEADWLLKQYSFGLAVDYLGAVWREAGERLPGHGVEAWGGDAERIFCARTRTVPVGGFQSIPEIHKATGLGGSKERRNRLWIVVKEPVRVGFDRGTCVFGPVVMGVEARRQEIGRDGKLMDVVDDARQDPVALKFAKEIMTAKYDEIAAVEPAFAAMREKAKAVAVAEWVKRCAGDMDSVSLDWALPILNRRSPGVLAVTRLGFTENEETVRREKTRQGERIVTESSSYSIFGGVDAKVKLIPKEDRAVAAASEAVYRSLREYPDSPIVPFKFDDSRRVGVVVPLTAESRARWKGRSSRTENGITYRVGPEGRVDSSTDAEGTVRRYVWGEDGSLVGVQALGSDGWVIQGGAPDATGNAAVSVTSPEGVRTDLSWSADLTRCEVREGGRPILDVRDEPAPDPASSAVRVITVADARDGARQRAAYDGKGRPIGYDSVTPMPDGTSAQESVRLEWGDEGRLHSIEAPGCPEAKFNYDDRGRLRQVAVGAEQLQFEYGDKDSFDLPTRVLHGSEVLAECRYDAGLLARLDLATPEGKVTAKFDAGRPSEVQDERGTSQKFEYHTDGSIKRVASSVGGEMTWAADGRLSEATLPGGVRAVPAYTEPSGGSDALAALSFFETGSE